jgi:tetratricopeptide (TPR) repeat protein
MPADVPNPVYEGALTQTPLAHVLVNIARRRLDGTLALWPEPEASHRGQDRILFERGIAVRMRPLEPVANLDRALGSLFARRGAPYAFYEADLVGRGERTLQGQVDPYGLVARALRGPAAHTHAEAMEQVIERLGSSGWQVRSEAPLHRYAFELDESRVIERLAHPATLPELVAEWGDPTVPRRVLYLLAITRSLAAVGSAATTSGPVASEGHPSRAGSTAPSPPVGSSPPSPTSAPPRARRSSRAPAAPMSAPPPPPDLPPELERRWTEIAERAEAIEHQTYFDMLGIDRSVGPSAVRDAYLEQVKHWHPDRLPPELQTLAPWVQRIFHHVTEARDTLSDAEQRVSYIKAVQGGGGTPDAERRVGAIVGAAMEFQKVEVLARRKHWDEALTVLEEALTLNPDEADFHAMRAWLLFQKHGSGEGAPVTDMRSSVDRALRLEPACVRAHYTKGLILKQLGDVDQALEHFRRVTELDPRHIEAAREVRIADMRGRGTSQAPPGGDRPSLLGKLFGSTKKK